MHGTVTAATQTQNNLQKISYALVAQLDRATDSDSVGRWFESSQARHDWVTKNVTQFFLVFMRVFGLLGTKSGKRFYRRYPTSKPQLNPPVQNPCVNKITLLPLKVLDYVLNYFKGLFVVNKFTHLYY